MEILEITISAIVTLGAAFAGSWSAFKLADREKSRETIRDQVAAVNRAQFALIQQINTLKNLQSKMIDPKRTDPLRLINMRPTLPVGVSSIRLNLDELLFLLETDDRDFPFLLMLEQERFDVAIQAINERSRIHVYELQPRLVAAGIVEGAECSLPVLAEQVGDDLLTRLERASDAVVEQVDLTLESCESLVARFYEAMKDRFPGQTIIRIAPAPPPNQ